MAFMDTTSRILKTDSRGRVHTPPERRLALVAEFERSGLSAMKFAALAGVPYQTFAAWTQKYRSKPKVALPPLKDKSRAAVRFAQVIAPASSCPASSKALRVLLPGGAIVELEDTAQAALAAQLIKHLA